jgi:outer membrane protein TolC
MALSANRRPARLWAVWLGGFIAVALALAAAPRPAAAETPAPPGSYAPQVRPSAADAAPSAAPLTLDQAVLMALEQNPGIIALRRDHGVAAAGVLVARAYPFNPLWEGRFRYAWPVFQGASNQEPFESTVTLELELRGQRALREAQAQAALSRTDWDIATQEMALAIHIIRAFDTVVYRYQKMELILETIKLNKDTADLGQNLVNAQKLRPADLYILKTEIAAAKALLAQSRSNLATASNDLRSALGVVGAGSFVLRGDLSLPPLPADQAEALAEGARSHRPDRRSREAALAEADAHLRLERANRFGNPTIGPTYEYDNSSIHNLGVQFAIPLPVLNTHRSDILQRGAEKQRALFDLRQTDVEISLEVEAAQTRLKQARDGAETYRQEVLPDLKDSLKKIQDLFEAGDPSVDALRILDVQRKVLAAQDGYLDAQLEERQAAADLAAALGDPSILIGPCPASAGHCP